MSRYVILLSALLFACHDKPAAAPTTPPPAPKPAPGAAPADVGTTAAPAPMGVSLSVVTQGKDGCQWERLDIASGQRQVVAIFPRQCPASIQPPMAWSADGKAALWNDGEALWRVTLATGNKTKLPALPTNAGSLDSFGFDRNGQPVALTLFSPGEEGKLEWDGKTFAPPQEGADGIPALAHAFRLGPNDQWQHAEVKVSMQGADYSPGVLVLDAAKGLVTGIPTPGEPRGEVVHDAKLIAGLNALFQTSVPTDGTESEVSWVKVADGAYDYDEMMEGRHSPTGKLAFGQPGALAKAPQIPEGDNVSVEAKSDYVLVATDKQARVYVPKQSKVALSLDGAKDVRFWP